MFIFKNSKGSLCEIAVIVFPARFFSVIPSGFTFFSQWIYTVILRGFTVDFSYQILHCNYIWIYTVILSGFIVYFSQLILHCNYIWIYIVILTKILEQFLSGFIIILFRSCNVILSGSMYSSDLVFSLAFVLFLSYVCLCIGFSRSNLLLVLISHGLWCKCVRLHHFWD